MNLFLVALGVLVVVLWLAECRVRQRAVASGYVGCGKHGRPLRAGVGYCPAYDGGGYGCNHGGGHSGGHGGDGGSACGH